MAWSASQYLKFEDERTRPARDLLAQVPEGGIRTAYDLGCGPGNSTELIAARFPAASVTGIDSDDDMLAAARDRLPGIAFEKADLADWQPSRPTDLLFANAAFQWLPDHQHILERLMATLDPGGVLAVQMPDNRREPTHVLMEETARSPAWASYFAGRVIARPALPSPSSYYNLLTPAASRIDIWHTIYNHPLADAAAIAEWVKGTGLRPYLDVLEPAMRDDFLADYTARLATAFPRSPTARCCCAFPGCSLSRCADRAVRALPQRRASEILKGRARGPPLRSFSDRVRFRRTARGPEPRRRLRRRLLRRHTAWPSKWLPWRGW